MGELPGGFVSFGRGRRAGADRSEEVSFPGGICRRRGFLDQKRRTELPSPDEIPSASDRAVGCRRDGVWALPHRFPEAEEGVGGGGGGAG